MEKNLNDDILSTEPQKIGNYYYFAIVAIGVRRFSTQRNLDSMHPCYGRSGVWGGAPVAECIAEG